MSSTESLNPDHVVHIVDADANVREELKRVLTPCHDVELHGSLHDFFNRAQLHGVGCLVIDASPPSELVASVPQQLADCDSTLATIVMSDHADVPSVISAFQAGCVGFLEKPVASEELNRLIEVGRKLSTRRWHQFRRARPIRGKLNRLTAAEQQVLNLMCEGFHVKRIASRLDRSPNTIRVHRSAILRKLEMETDTQLVGSVLSLQQ